MEIIFSEIIEKISQGNGFALSLVGMGVVFCGLLTLLVTMLLLKKSISIRENRKARKELASVKEPEEEEVNMEEVAAVIGLSLNLHQLRHSTKKITIKRLLRSSWKESLRAKAMNRF